MKRILVIILLLSLITLSGCGINPKRYCNDRGLFFKDFDYFQVEPGYIHITCYSDYGLSMTFLEKVR